ncbi:hypothetical protein PTE30175_02529 [Pandoraea terrae]|uniref:Uncharacterized protein n=1 Tax=Pandoraea terrae TaxID=1537710 RepID=A0A5E4VDM5_9BURK|nr:hypothetical protein [Pandoraea terrae]VVE10388.1 hypothetical protein PTE30175_02529 [Pandoraea terrae]
MNRFSVERKDTLISDFIGRMREHGSTAKTFRGALRFAKTHMPVCIPGIGHLKLPGRDPVTSTGRTIDFDTQYNRSHSERIKRRALAICLPLAGETPLERIHLRHSVCRNGTPDLRRAIETLSIEAAEQQVGAMLIENWPYRQSESSWAGGEHSVAIKIAEIPDATGTSRRVWSANGKWSGNNSAAHLSITERCLHQLGANLVVGRLVTLDAGRIGPREYKAVWAEQGRGFGLKVVEGWIIRGYHVAGGTEVAARRKASTARRARLDSLLAARRRYRLGDDRHDLASVTVTPLDSLAVGNCRSGTSSFIKKFDHQIAGRSAVSGAELLEWRDDSYTRAALSAALARTRSKDF